MASATETEIDSQPTVWEAAMEAGRRAAPALARLPAPGMTLGCGSAFYAADFCARVVDGGQGAQAWPSGDLLVRPATVDGTASVVAFSRSGETDETIQAVASLPGKRVVVTCAPQSTLAGKADVVIAVPEAHEASVVQTRSFTSMCLAWTAAMGLIGPETLAHIQWADHGQRAREAIRETLAGWLPSHVYVLGGGPDRALAMEVALKVTEMSLTPAVGLPILEFRHGPISMASPKTLVVSFAATADEDLVLDESASHGARVLRLVAPAGTPDLLTGLCRMPMAQLLALELAERKGLDPDHPRHLTSYVTLPPRS